MDDRLRDDLIDIIHVGALLHGRAMQKRIGPSQLGIDCDRRLLFEMSGEQIPGPVGDPLLPMIGTAFHAWLENAAHLDNARRASQGAPARWIPETRVSCDVDGFVVEGTCDLFDLATGTVIDHKTLGINSMKSHSVRMSQQYRVQAHVYGLGYSQMGHDVKSVAIFMIPRNGPLRAASLWQEEFDPDLATAAIKRAQALEEFDPARWRSGEATPSDACRFCPARSRCPEAILWTV